jgi:hypothetical protein
VDGRHATSPAEMFEVCLEVSEAELELSCQEQQLSSLSLA